MKNPSTLAIDGGAPVRTAPWPAWPVFADDEIAAVRDVLASGKVNYWTGDTCRRFEDEYAAFCGRRHAIAVANGTLALELALIALELQPGDEVIVPARTFIATASCVVARGGVPVVADVDADSQNLTADSIRAALTPRTRGVIVVHLGGWPVDMDPVLTLAREKNLFVVEDCAQAHGATYKGKPVGSFGHAAAFSFCQDKIISTGGEGGLLLLDDDAQWKRAWAYKDHGKSFDAVHRQDHPPGFRWLHESFGSNFRLTELQAAIGRLQLAKLSQWLAARTANAHALHESLAGVPGLRCVLPPTGTGHAFYRYYAFLDTARLAPGWGQTWIVTAIQAEGVPCQVGSCSEIYLEKAFQNRGLSPATRLPVARGLAETSLAFLVHPSSTPADMRDVAQAVAKVMGRATTS
jgi:dTDP-4-amino-4,6-dideoxygalactose transaminase